jgi:hypothetical protein
MKPLIFALCVVIALSCEGARADSWQPSSGHTQVPIWPGAVPDAIPNPKPESVGPPPPWPQHWGGSGGVPRRRLPVPGHGFSGTRLVAQG